MRIAVGRLFAELNHFSPVPATVRSFETMGIFYGGEIFHQTADVWEIGGFMEAASAEPSVELVPTMSAWAMPAGRLEDDTHEFLKDRFLEGLRGVGDLDGILLALHGAMSSEDEPDVEGDLLETIRAEWGEGVPIVVTLDHHANITRKIIDSVDALAGYQTEPHVDSFDTGVKAAGIMFQILRGEVRPTIRWRKIPMIATGNLLAPEGPLGPFFAEAQAYEKREDVLAVSIFPEFPYADTPELGWSVVAVTDDEGDLAQQIANHLAKGLWEKRRLFLPEGRPSPTEAVKRALATAGGPVVLGDYGDNTAGGATGDSPAVLSELLGKELDGKALVTIVDPEAVMRAIEGGVGEFVTVEVGGKIDTLHYQPVELTGRVKALTDGRYSSLLGETSMGRTAVLEVGDIYVVLSETAGPNVDPGIYRSVGLEPEDAKIVLVKSAYNFRAYYGSFAREMMVVDSPGVTSQDLPSRSDEYKLAPRPLFPLDEDASFDL
jgi:microcystin degradation protein MlrC